MGDMGLVLAAVPLFPQLRHWQFYHQTGICIPLPVTRSDFHGHGYAFGVMIVLNFVLFLLIAVGPGPHLPLRAAQLVNW
jgi:hypothetical protein